jgi:tetratricopeptide (TPR) repeat protein
MPLLGLAGVLVNVTIVVGLMLRRPELLPSILPALALAVQVMRPSFGFALGSVFALAGLWLAPLALAAVPAATAATLHAARHRRSWAPAVIVALVGFTAYHVHSASARDQADMIRRLDAALASRDRGDLDSARRALTALVADFPGSHVPPSLLGELEYRTDRLDEARRLFAVAVQIKQDHKEGLRYLAVIDLRQGRKESAAHEAERGLEIDGTTWSSATSRHAREGFPWVSMDSNPWGPDALTISPRWLSRFKTNRERQPFSIALWLCGARTDGSTRAA